MPRPAKFHLRILGAALAGLALHAADTPMNSTTFTNASRTRNRPTFCSTQHNPVDWYPWGEEAFAKARRENKPIFLSVGYSTCHWCHVMAHESFENPETGEADERAVS